MASTQAARMAMKETRPLLSVDRDDARRRVLNLYRAWYKQVPNIVRQYDIPKNEEQCRAKLREEFMKHKDLDDIRVIDMLVVKGQMELKETVMIWKQKGHIMNFWKPTWEPKPTDFLSKFLQGN